MIREHHNLMRDGYRCLLTPQARFKAPERPPQKGRGLASRPRTLDEDTSQVAIPFPCPSMAALARTFVVARTQASPRCQTRRRPKAAHICANLGDDVPCGRLVHTRDTVELGELRP